MPPNAFANSSSQTYRPASTKKHGEGDLPFELFSKPLVGKTYYLRLSRMVLRESVDLTAIDPKKLTNDCKFVHHCGGRIDLVREYSSVRIFDHYWDRGIRVTRIEHAGGHRNPKFEKPEF